MSSFFPKSTQPPRIHWVHVALPRGASLPACEEHRRQATSGRPGLVGSGCPRPLLGRDVEFVAGPVVGGWGGSLQGPGPGGLGRPAWGTIPPFSL